jgi:hypothetical protein
MRTVSQVVHVVDGQQRLTTISLFLLALHVAFQRLATIAMSNPGSTAKTAKQNAKTIGKRYLFWEDEEGIKRYARCLNVKQ